MPNKVKKIEFDDLDSAVRSVKSLLSFYQRDEDLRGIEESIRSSLRNSDTFSKTVSRDSLWNIVIERKETKYYVGIKGSDDDQWLVSNYANRYRLTDKLVEI